MLISSTSTVLAPEGQAAYVAANSVLDALAGDHGDLQVRTVNYGLWAELGIAADAAHRARLGLEAGTPVTHPVLGELSTDRDGTVRVSGTLATGHHWVVDEHRTRAGIALLPGTGHLELMLAALAAAGSPDATLRSVMLLEPLVVPDGVPVAVRVSIGGCRRVTATSSSSRTAGSGRGASTARPRSARRPARRRRSPSPTDRRRPSTWTRWRAPASQVDFGPRWNAVGDAWRDGSVVSGRLALPEPYRTELDAWRAHPALVDVATAYGVLLGERVDSLYVPIGYDAVASYAPLPAEPLVTVVARRGVLGGGAPRRPHGR